MMIERFYLTIVVITSIATAGAAFGLTLSSRIRSAYKPSFLYFLSLVLVYEVSTLLAFYLQDEGAFRTAVLFKSFGAVLMKSAFLLVMGAYLGIRWVRALFLAVHLLCYPFIMAHFLFPALMNAMFVFKPDNSVFYGSGTLWYALISNFFYLVAGVLLYLKWRANKVKGSLFLFVVIGLNIVMMTYFMATQTEMLSEKMHMVVLVGLLLFDLQKTPFVIGKNQFLVHAEILEALSDEVLIYNEKGRLAYVHKGLEQIRPCMQLSEMLRFLHKEETDVSQEGDFTLNGDKPPYLHYKILPVHDDGKDFGTIIVIRDMTPFVTIRMELEQRNRQLIEACSKQREYVKLSKKLISEEERAKILERVNGIADAYITGVREEILKLQEAIIERKENMGALVEEKNAYMLGLTRKALEEIRGTVKKLNIQQSGRA